MNDARPWLQRVTLVLLITVFAVLVFGRGITRDLNHDEHQFLAPAALLSRQGLLPYCDYPLLHLPNLIFAYALLDRLGAPLVLGAKLFSMAATILVGALLVLVCCPAGTRTRAALAGAGGLLMLVFFDPLFDFTIGKTWNHEFPALCLIVALLLTTWNARRNHVALAILAGVAAGIAVGCRLTFLTVGAPLCGAALLFGLPWKRRFVLVAAAAGGFVLAMTPTLWLWVKSPEAFLFDNFEFPRLRLLDPTDTRAQKTTSLWRKVRYFFKEVALPSWPLFLAYAVIGVAPAIRWFRERTAALLPNALVLLAIPFTLMGCFAPSRYQYQHYYVFVPLLGLGIAYGMRVRGGRWSDRSPVVVLVLAAAGVVAAMLPSRSGDYAWMREMWQPREWYPTRVREIATSIRVQVTHGKVLTLAPTWPLEAGLEIYPEFATGAFIWRAAELMKPERRPALHYVAPSDLIDFLAKDPPVAVLTGVEDEKLEKPLREYAQSQQMQPVKLGKHRTLWILPVDRPEKSP